MLDDVSPSNISFVVCRMLCVCVSVADKMDKLRILKWAFFSHSLALSLFLVCVTSIQTPLYCLQTTVFIVLHQKWPKIYHVTADKCLEFSSSKCDACLKAKPFISFVV